MYKSKYLEKVKAKPKMVRQVTTHMVDDVPVYEVSKPLPANSAQLSRRTFTAKTTNDVMFPIIDEARRAFWYEK